MEHLRMVHIGWTMAESGEYWIHNGSYLIIIYKRIEPGIQHGNQIFLWGSPRTT